MLYGLRVFRLAVAGFLVLGLVVPVALPVVAAVRSGEGATAWREWERLASLAGHTLALAAGACLLAVPAGTLFALVVERGQVPGRAVLRAVVGIGLFVPLPVYAVAWQVVLGTWLPPLTLEPGQVAWRPWRQGLLPAIWVHGLAGFPWVVWIVAAGLRMADRTLEEDALLAGGPAAVLVRVFIPRAMLASLVAGGWVAAQTATEIPITDAMMVRTFAEEVYTQLVAGSGAVGAAVVATVPAWLAAALVGWWVVRLAGRTFDVPPGEAERPLELRWGRPARGMMSVAVWGVAGLFAGLPLAALVWKAGGGGTPGGWSTAALGASLQKVLRTDGEVLLGSLGTAVATGLAAAGLAWLACWLAEGARWARVGLVALCLVLVVAPGPLAGLGLKDAINFLVDLEARVLAGFDLRPLFPPLRSALSDQPSPLPAVWAALLRLFPVAVALIWPALRAIPRELKEAARLDGFSPLGEWRVVVIPFTGAAATRAVLAVAALALGEISASKLVNPPGRTAFVLRLFDQMHYGAESTVAALTLLQLLAAVLLAAAVVGFVPPGIPRRARTG